MDLKLYILPIFRDVIMFNKWRGFHRKKLVRCPMHEKRSNLHVRQRPSHHFCFDFASAYRGSTQLVLFSTETPVELLTIVSAFCYCGLTSIGIMQLHYSPPPPIRPRIRHPPIPEINLFPTISLLLLVQTLFIVVLVYWCFLVFFPSNIMLLCQK